MDTMDAGYQEEFINRATYSNEELNIHLNTR